MAAKRIVLVGGGHAHALVLERWARGRRPDAAVTLVSPDRYTAYSGMLPGHVAGHYGWSDIHINVERLARAADVELLVDRVCGLDPHGGRAALEGGLSLGFDALSLDIGSTSEPSALAETIPDLVPVKPTAPFLEAWQRLRRTGGRTSVAIIGGGVGGCELALAMASALGNMARIALVEQAPALVPELPAPARRRITCALDRHGVAAHVGAAVVGANGASLSLSDGREVAAAFIVAAAGARAAPWLRDTGLALAADGCVRVDRCLRSVSAPSVFAVGDVAHLDDAPRAKAGVFAVRQGPVLARSLEALVAGGDAVGYRPQTDHLRLISLGERRALAVRSGLAVGGGALLGPVLWRLKNRIDRRFMSALAMAP